MASGSQVGVAYVEIVPKLGGSGVSGIESDLGKVDGEKAGGKAGRGIVAGIKNTAIGVALGNILTKGVEAAVGGIKDTIAGAFNNYADYEQLVGGVDKLFGDASQRLQDYAAEAYKTSGVSANEYMQQVTSFSAALINDMGGDTMAAADMADVAMRLMSDNVNTFGSDAQSVQDAIMGLSRGNFTMLDNLKLGFAGSKEGMQELIDAANEYAEANGLAADLSIDSFADMVQAIQYVQEAQGIAGTTANEAASTISGSIATAKAAWQDFLTALGNPDADLGDAFGKLAESLVTAAQNAIPIVANIFQSIGEAIPMALEYVFTQLPDQLLPMLTEAFDTLASEATGPLGEAFRGMGEFIQQLSPAFDSVKSIADSVVAFVTENMPMFEEIAGKIGEIAGIVGGILAGAINTVMGALEVVIPIVLDLASAALPAVSGALDGISGVLTWLSEMFMGFYGVIEICIGWLAQIYEVVAPYIQAAFELLGEALTTVGDYFRQASEGARQDWQALQDWIRGLPERIINFFSSFAASMGEKFNAAKEKMKEAFQQAKDFIQGIPDAILGFFGNIAADIGAKFDEVYTAITTPIEDAKTAVGNAIQAIKDFLNVTLPHPHIPMPSFSVSGEFDPLNGKLPHVSVSWNAMGGIIDGATLIGVGEAGAEAVVPLENPRAMRPFAEAVAEGLEDYMGDEALIAWLSRNLGPIIADYTPTLTKRELNRMVSYA